MQAKSKVLLSVILSASFSEHGLSLVHAQKICTEMGCMNGLQIDIAEEYQWEAGTYKFAFLLDGKSATCTGTLPLSACGKESVTCDSAGTAVGITESGCALPAASQGFGDINVDQSPAAVSLRITRDDIEIGSERWSPAYTTVKPNGEGCEPTCRQAMVSMVLRGGPSQPGTAKVLSPLLSPEQVDKERLHIEQAGVSLVKEHFNDDLGARRLLESYAETDPDDGRSIVFTAIAVYVAHELAPKLPNNATEKQRAAKELDALWKKHIELD